MITIDCPWCGVRDADEFAWHDEATVRPRTADTGPAEWRRHLYLRDNPSGWTREHWLHRAGCRRWLVVERHATTNDIRACVDAATAGGRP